MRLRDALARGGRLEPKWQSTAQSVPRSIWHDLDEARALAPSVPGGDLYLARLDELELELMLLEALGETKRVRPLAARRFGTGAHIVHFDSGPYALHEVATHLLADLDGRREPRTLPAAASQGDSLAACMLAMAKAAGLNVEVRVEPALVANAACGERTIYIADRMFGVREARRLAVHEVLGHLVAAANGRAQPLALLQVGTAESLADQEGLALWLEESAGLMDTWRLRTFAARVWVTDRVHEGVSFHDAVLLLVREHGFRGDEAIALAERAYRGGGVARDCIYLRGWLRVRRALQRNVATVDELRAGKLSLSALPAVRRLQSAGQLREALHVPSLSRSLEATTAGTSSSTLPPSFAASLMRFDET